MSWERNFICNKEKGGMEMLNKYNLQIANLLEKEDDFTLNVQHIIKVTKDKTIATNRRLLIEVTRPDLPYEEFPETEHEYKQDRDFYLTKNEIAKIQKLIPKTKGLPILENVMVSQKKDKTTLITTDLVNTFTMSVKDRDIKYPKTDEIYPKESPVATFIVNAKLLKEIATQVENLVIQKKNQLLFLFIKMNSRNLLSLKPLTI